MAIGIDKIIRYEGSASKVGKVGFVFSIIYMNGAIEMIVPGFRFIEGLIYPPGTRTKGSFFPAIRCSKALAKEIYDEVEKLQGYDHFAGGEALKPEKKACKFLTFTLDQKAECLPTIFQSGISTDVMTRNVVEAKKKPVKVTEVAETPVLEVSEDRYSMYEKNIDPNTGRKLSSRY